MPRITKFKVKYHKELAKGRRYTMTFAQQMANIWWEVYRSFNAKSLHPERLDWAIERALELFDMTMDDTKLSSWQRKELCRSREIFCDSIFWYHEYVQDDESFQRYFDNFALIGK